VLLPFSGGGYYEEFLVNSHAITTEFAAKGFSRAHTPANVAESIPEFASRQHSLGSSLTDGDRAYLALYGEICFVRDK